MNLLENMRNSVIGFAIAFLLPLTVYVGTRLILNPVYPTLKHAAKDDAAAREENKIKKENYEKEHEKFRQYYFYSSAFVGLLSLFLAVFIIPIPFLSMGFILGGTFCLLSAYMYYWNDLNNLVKFVSLLAALFVLIIASFRFTKGQ